MNVLVADHNPVIRMALSRLLAKWGYSVTAVSDGEQAWHQLCSKGGPRMAILAWVMPGMDGPQVCQRVRSERRNEYVYVLLITAKDDVEDVVAGMEAGADDYLTKPFDPEVVRLRLRVGCRVLESEERYRVMAQTASDGIVTSDDAGKIQFANDAAAAIFGYSPDELLHIDLDSLVPGFFKQVPGHLELDGRTCAPVELLGKHKGGREMPLEISASQYLQGPFNHRTTLVVRDITERKLAERHLAQSQRLESIGQLAAGIAHEINTPIQYIGDNLNFLFDSFGELTGLITAYKELGDMSCSGTGPTQTAREAIRATDTIDLDYLRAEVPKAIQQSLDGVKRVAEIVGAMKELSHPGAAAKTAVDLNHIIRNAIVVSKNSWKYVAEVTTDFDERLPTVTCIPGDVGQVMVNLIINAADAISDLVKNEGRGPGCITVSTRCDGQVAEIRVTDTGTGIPEVVQGKVFDPFFTTKDVGKGTGQGLAIAHAIVVQKHKGTIRFETSNGAGTTFIIRLPIQCEESEPQLEESSAVYK